jgi:hypothetical protein
LVELGVPAAIDFDRKSSLSAVEVDDESADRVLATESRTEL